MTIRARIEDAVLLDKAGRWEGALLSVLVAVAATSRKRYPLGTKSNRKPKEGMRDGEAFETFVHTDWLSKTGVTFGPEGSMNYVVNGITHSVEHILYKWFRCELAHEAGLPGSIAIVGAPSDSSVTLGADGTQFLFSRSHLGLLVRAVVEAPENALEFPGGLAPLAPKKQKRRP